jgi:hypothetical protein
MYQSLPIKKNLFFYLPIEIWLVKFWQKKKNTFFEKEQAFFQKRTGFFSKKNLLKKNSVLF